MEYSQYRENMKVALQQPERYEKHKQIVKDIYKNNTPYRLTNKYRATVRNVCNKYNIKGVSFEEIVGCSSEQLIDNLMDRYNIKTWDNCSTKLAIQTNIPLQFIDKSDDLLTQIKYCYDFNNCKLNIYNNDKFEITYTQDKLNTRFAQYLNTTGNYSAHPVNNILIYHFFPHILDNYRKFLSTTENINKYKQNRIKYINKRYWEMPCDSLIINVKPSGFTQGYSHFSPLWFKAFIEETSAHRVYDPCGGWGQRMIGGNALDLYIYNDIWNKSYESAKKMASFLNITNTKFYNCDSSILTPSEIYDTIFTCPPYYNIEIYDQSSQFATIEHYKNWWNNTIEHAITTNVKCIGVVIDQLYKDIIQAPIIKRGFNLTNTRYVGIQSSTHFCKQKKSYECLLIFTK